MLLFHVQFLSLGQNAGNLRKQMGFYSFEPQLDIKKYQLLKNVCPICFYMQQKIELNMYYYQQNRNQHFFDKDVVCLRLATIVECMNNSITITFYNVLLSNSLKMQPHQYNCMIDQFLFLYIFIISGGTTYHPMLLVIHPQSFPLLHSLCFSLILWCPIVISFSKCVQIFFSLKQLVT